MKRISMLGLCLILALMSFTTYVFADTQNSVPAAGIVVDIPYEPEVSATPRSLLPEAYQVRNKIYLSPQKVTVKWITSIWAPSDGYSVSKGTGATYSLQLSGSGDLKGFKLSGAFTVSKQYTETVLTHIPANPNKLSKLAMQCNYKKYTADLYYLPPRPETSVMDWQYSGNSTVLEPSNDVFYEVIYK